MNKKLLEVLCVLDKSEHKRFRLFLESPYFNRGSRALPALRLYDLLHACKFRDSHPQLRDQALLAVLFPETNPAQQDTANIDLVATELFRLLRLFLVQIKVENDHPEERELLVMAAFYRKNGMENRFFKTQDALRKRLDTQPFRGPDFFQMQYELETEYSQYRRLNNSAEDDANLLRVDKCLDILYLIRKMDLICALEFQGKLTDLSKFNSTLTRLIKQYGPGETYAEAPILQIYTRLLHLLQTPEDEELMSEFETIFSQHEKFLPLEYQQVLSSYLRFFWTRKYSREGNQENKIKLFNIYKSHYDKGYFYINQKIAATNLRNLLIFALKNNQLEWVKSLLDKHGPDQITGTKYAAEVYGLNYAEYYFYIGDYEKALQHLVYKNFENSGFSILADVLMIKVFYETQNELLEYRVNSMRQKVVRAAFTAEVKSRYHNFVNKMEKLIKYGWDKGNPKIAKLLEETQTMPNIIEREWLLEKMQALLPPKK